MVRSLLTPLAPLLLLLGAGVAWAEPENLSLEDGVVPAPAELAGVAWTEGGAAWVLVRGTATWLRVTTDGGKTWSQIALEHGAARPLGPVGPPPVFVNVKSGVVSAGGSTWVTTNGGKVWKDAFPAYLTAGSSDGLLWVAVPTSPTAWQSRVSEDGGRTWLDCGSRMESAQGLPGASELRAGGAGWMVGATGPSPSPVWTSFDGGCNWIRGGDAPAGAWRGISGLDPKRAWLVGGRGEVVATADGGKSWTPLAAPEASAVFFASATQGWIIAPDGRLHQSDDGGATWSGLSREAATTVLNSASVSGWRAGRALALLLAGGAPYPNS